MAQQRWSLPLLHLSGVVSSRKEDLCDVSDPAEDQEIVQEGSK